MLLALHAIVVAMTLLIRNRHKRVLGDLGGRLSLCCWGIPILALLDEAGLGFTKRFAGFGPDHQNTVFVRISKARTNHKPESTAQTKQLQ